MQCKLPLPNTNELLSMCVIFVPNEESDEDGDDEANGEAAEGEPAERASGTGGTEGCNTVLTTEECMSNNMGHGVRGAGWCGEVVVVVLPLASELLWRWLVCFGHRWCLFQRPRCFEFCWCEVMRAAR